MAETQAELMEEEGLSKRERQKLNKEKSSSGTNKKSILNKLIVVGGIVALAVGAFWFIYSGAKPTSSIDSTTTTPTEVTSTDRVKGPENALITLVVYEDYQCPACAAYNPIVNQIADEFKNDLRLVHRHYPLRSIHKNAQIASQAAEAAGDQGMFWEMNDILYSRQEEWVNTRDPRIKFKEYANELTLNIEQFESYMNSDAAKSKVDSDYASGLSAGIDATPTFYINGEKVQSNPQGLEPFRQLILGKLAELMPEGRGEEATDSGEATPEGEVIPQL